MPAKPVPTDTTTADQFEGSTTTALYRGAIGPVNTHYYLPLFNRFEAADRVGMSWNWGAALCTLNWMAYRKLWSAALVYAGAVVGLSLMVFGIGRLVFQFPPALEYGLLLAFVIAAFALPGLFGNAVFYAQCRKKMADALLHTATLPEACAQLNRAASSRQRLAWLTVANAVVVGVVLVGYLAVPKGGPLPEGPSKVAEVRNLALDRALEAASKPAAPASAPTPALPPAESASAPLAPASAPNPATAASTPASAPVPEREVPVAHTPPKEEFVETKAAAVAPSLAVSKAVTAQPIQEPKDSATPVAKVVAKVVPKASIKAAEKPPAKASKVAKATQTEKTSPKKAAATTAKASTLTKPVAASASGDAFYFVNVGLFADDNNARNAYVKLTDAGLGASKQELKTKKGLLTRVRVGPFDTEHEAQTAADRVRALGLDAVLFKP